VSATNNGAPGQRAHVKDLIEVLGHTQARKAIEICAAGGHNLSLLGPSGAGKTMLAERLPTILPKLDVDAALEVTSIYSVAGALAPGSGLLTEPPFCAPHHTASIATSARQVAAITRASGTKCASAAFSAATTTVLKPLAVAAITAGSTPGTGRRRPSRPSPARNMIPCGDGRR
jgi:hypothetical protein